MQKRDRFALVVAVCLFAVSVSAWAQTEVVYFTVTPNQIYLYDVETFVTIRGVVPGSESTFVLYSDGVESNFQVEPSSNPGTPGVLDAWVPIGVSTNAGRYNVSVVATDVGGVTRTYGPVFFDVVERPNTDPPQLNLPESLVVEATSSEGANVFFDAGGATCDHTSGNPFSMGQTTVTCSATNEFGTTTGTFSVFVTDTVSPVLTVPEEVVSASNVVTFTTSAVDNIDGSVEVTCNHASGSTFANGQTLVQCSARDSHANFAYGSFNVFVQQGPVLRLPGDITAEASGPGGTSVAYAASADGATISCLPASGSTFPLGLTVVQCEASNGAGTSTGTFGVTVVDTSAPVVTTPGDIVRSAANSSGAVVTFTATAYDLVDGAVAVTCNPPSGSTFPIGTTNVVCTASDAHSNVGGATFFVTVGADLTPPVLTLPANITKEATSSAGAVVTFTATAVDDVDGSVPVTCSPASGSMFAIGTTTVNCTATDAAGNVGEGSFTVTVGDTTPPTVVSTTPSQTTLWPPNHQMVAVSVAVIATDTIDPSPVSTILSVSSNQPINGTGDGDTAPDWVITGPLTLNLRAERAGGSTRIYTITVATTDFSGNTAISTCQVTVANSNGKGRAAH